MYLETLNEAQRRAVTTVDGAVLVLAGPGSGKTRVLTHRIAYLMLDRGIPARQIMAVTFTNKAASEMRERISTLVEADVSALRLGTFHARCARILRREADYTAFDKNFTIYDTGDQLSLIKNILNEIGKDPKQNRPNAILGAISSAKNELITPDEFPAMTYREQIVQEVYRRYVEKLQRNNAMDFDDLLTQSVVLFRNNPDVLRRYQDWIRYLMVDEFQDTNMAQYEMLKLLAGSRGNLFVVGDPDQSIYAFRGADYRNVQRFQRDYPDNTIITLDENYRSHQIILDAAMAVIRKDPNHIPRNLFSQRSNGPRIEIHELASETDEAVFVVQRIRQLIFDEGYAPRDFAVMYRTNAQSRTMEEAFRRDVMPYRIVGGTRFYERREIKDIMAYLRLIANPDDEISFERIVNVPPRGIGKKTLATFTQWGNQRGVSQWVALQNLLDGQTGPLSARAAKALTNFAEMLDRWVQMRDAENFSLLELLDTVIEQTEYRQYLENQASEREPDRLENIDELMRGMSEYEGGSLFDMLETVALLADIDNIDETDDSPTMMTLHAAKGSEYPVVFMIGLEEDLLPHSRSKDDPMQMSEERRLMYVGITRAKDRLYLTHANVRFGFGGGSYNDPSRFLYDLPPEICNFSGGSTRPQANFRSITSWAPLTQASRPQQAKFAAGMRVSHPVFGSGIVISSKVHSDMEEVSVKFETSGVKRLDAEFLEAVR